MKELNMLLLTIGGLLLAFGYVPWWIGHKDVQILTAENVPTIIAGWALTVMGYVGLLLTARSARREVHGFPVMPPPPKNDA